MNDTPPPVPPPPVSVPPALPSPRPRRAGYGTVLKMLMVAVLTLVLLIPLHMIQRVLSERLTRRNEAISDITSTWGAPQVLFGPVLIVPYKYEVKVFKDRLVNGRMEKFEATESQVAHAFFLPEDLRVTGDLKTDKLHRGIYRAVVYRGAFQVSGAFARPTFEDWKVAPADVLWEDAVLSLAITDLRGAREALFVKWGEQSIALEPGSKVPGFASGVSARIKDLAEGEGPLPFDISLHLNGSSSFSVIPAGRTTDVQLTSAWPDPKFDGALLPSERKVLPSGFEAHWQSSYYGRTFPPRWTSREHPSSGSGPSAAFSAQQAGLSAFRVGLLSLVDGYRLVERSIKYGILFLVLVFTAFFLFEILVRVRVHPFQYTLVGVALCLFFLALLSLSEVIPFGAAYLGGAAASTLMITLYSACVLRSLRRALVVATELSVIYGFLFVILRLQDFSLLLGTSGLFLALAIVMFATRNIDWYARDEKA